MYNKTDKRKICKRKDKNKNINGKESRKEGKGRLYKHVKNPAC
jgi:hypothetical protein